MIERIRLLEFEFRTKNTRFIRTIRRSKTTKYPQNQRIIIMTIARIKITTKIITITPMKKSVVGCVWKAGGRILCRVFRTASAPFDAATPSASRISTVSASVCSARFADNPSQKTAKSLASTSSKTTRPIASAMATPRWHQSTPQSTMQSAVCLPKNWNLFGNCSKNPSTRSFSTKKCEQLAAARLSSNARIFIFASRWDERLKMYICW